MAAQLVINDMSKKNRIDDDVLGFACVYGPWEVLEQRVPPLAALGVGR